MKKVMFWLTLIGGMALITDLLFMASKLLGGNYDVIAEGYIALGCLWLWIAGMIGRAVLNRCPHCGKVIWEHGAYCPHCGKRTEG